MFSCLKIFLIYFLTPSCINTLTINDDRTTKTSDTIELVEKEIRELKFDELANDISNVEKKGKFYEFEGSLTQLLKWLHRRARKADELLEMNGTLEKEKDKADVYRVLLGIGRRVDTLEELLACDSNVSLSGPRDKRWNLILKLETPIVQEFRSRIIAAGLTVEFFAKTVQQIFQERNERAVHVDVSLPEGLKSKTLYDVLNKMKIPKDEPSKRVIQLLLSPLTLPRTKSP